MTSDISGPSPLSGTSDGSGPATADPAASFAAAVAALHARLDAWADTIRTVGASDSAGPDAPDDPRLESAEEEFEAAVVEFHRAAGPVLGLEPAAASGDADLEVEELALHLLVGLPEDVEDPPRDAGTMVHEAGERLVAQLIAAGYEVPAWQFGCEIELLLDEDDDEGDGGDEDEDDEP